MAYTQKHLRNHVMELQKYLHGISYYNPQIPRIVPDGIYDRETETTVKSSELQEVPTEISCTNSSVALQIDAA